jgi:hypothetical protein
MATMCTALCDAGPVSKSRTGTSWQQDKVPRANKCPKAQTHVSPALADADPLG